MSDTGRQRSTVREGMFVNELSFTYMNVPLLTTKIFFYCITFDSKEIEKSFTRVIPRVSIHSFSNCTSADELT
jgi:hypothetical protein